MRDLLRLKYLRKKFTDGFTGEYLPVRKFVPVEVNGSVAEIITSVPYQKQVEEIPYSAFTAARVYQLGELTPIQLYNNLSSAEKLQYVQSFESMVDDAMIKVNSQK